VCFNNFYPTSVQLDDHPLPGSAQLLPEGDPQDGRAPSGEGLDQRRETTIDLCTQRCLRPGTRPDARLNEFYDRSKAKMVDLVLLVDFSQVLILYKYGIHTNNTGLYPPLPPNADGWTSLDGVDRSECAR